MISKNTAQKANEAMMAGKTLDSYELPEAIKKKLRERRYSQGEINQKFKLYCESKNDTSK